MNALKVNPGSTFAALAAARRTQCRDGGTCCRCYDHHLGRCGSFTLGLGDGTRGNPYHQQPETDPVEAVHKITNGGADFTLESSGRPAVLRQAIDALAIREICGIVGAPALGTEASFDVNGVMTAGKRIIESSKAIANDLYSSTG